MLNSKLLDVLCGFSPKQLKWFDEFLRSPYFNKDHEVVTLYHFILKYSPRFSHADLEKEMVYQKAFKSKKTDEKKLGYLMSDLLWYLEQFIVIQRMENDPVRNNRTLMLHYIDEDLEKHFRGKMRETEQLQQKNPYRDSDYFFNQFLIESTNNYFFDKQSKHVFNESLQQAIDNLDLYYLALKLKYSCEMMNRKNVMTADYRLRLLDEILLYLKQNSFDHVPAISIYFKILLTLTESENENHFNDLKKLLADHAAKFPQREARDMFAYAQNYCIKKINSGNPKYLEELFVLYKTSLDAEILIEGKFLSPWTYKNIVGVALRVKEFEWTSKFINDYKERLSLEFRENAFRMNLAYYHFLKNEFSDALELLAHVEFTDLIYALETKTLLLRIYYELDEIEPLFSLIDSFKVYLRRNKLISDYQLKVHLNLLKYVKKLIKLRKGEYEKSEELKNEILSVKQIAGLDWLLKKTEEKGKKKTAII